MTDSTGHGSVEPDPTPDPTSRPAAPGPQSSYGTQSGYGAQTGHGAQGYPPAAYPPAGHAPAGYSTMSPADERTWAMLSHLSAFIASFFVLAFIGPLIVYLLYKDRSAFVRRHAAESLNFQLSLLVYWVVGGVLGAVLALITLGLALIPLLVVALFAVVGIVVVMVQACVAGNSGREYRYPLTIRFVS